MSIANLIDSEYPFHTKNLSIENTQIKNEVTYQSTETFLIIGIKII